MKSDVPSTDHGYPCTNHRLHKSCPVATCRLSTTNIYEALRLKVTVAADGTPRIQGIVDAQVIRLTRGVEDYGQEVAEYRSRLKVSSSNRTATVMSVVVGEQVS